MMGLSLESALFRSATKNILLFLLTHDNVYISRMSKEVNITYSYTCDVITILEYNGCINTLKTGRIKLIKLTDKGVDIANRIGELKKLLN